MFDDHQMFQCRFSLSHFDHFSLSSIIIIIVILAFFDRLCIDAIMIFFLIDLQSVDKIQHRKEKNGVLAWNAMRYRYSLFKEIEDY